MKNPSKFVVLALIGMVAGLLACTVIERFKTKNANPLPASALKVTRPKANPPTDPASDGRHAVVSADGRTVAMVTGEKTLTILRDGKALSTVKSLQARAPRMALNRDGSRFAAYDIWKGGVTLVDTATGKEVAFLEAKHHNSTFEFSPKGDTIGVMVAYGPNEVNLFWASSGSKRITIPCRLEFQVSGEAVREDRELEKFYFPGGTKDALHINMITKKGGMVQWKEGIYGWSFMLHQQHWAMEDQTFDRD